MDKPMIASFLAGGGIGFLAGIWFMLVFIESPYRHGQIDAANGQQHYHLVTQPDGSTKWERKDDEP